MYPHPTANPTQRRPHPNHAFPANRLDPHQRQRLAVEALAGTLPISQLAQQHDVSRKFVYQQADQAQQALDLTFAPDPGDGHKVLFTLPVTKALLQQMVLGLTLICHSSFRGAIEFLRDILDYPLSLGSVANIVHAAMHRAALVNARQDLSGVRIGAHDEIFQARQPVLVGVDADSTYCYLLSQQEHRDADTWARLLVPLKERHFQPEATIADFAAGLRAGHDLALPGVSRRSDVFHIVYEFGKVLRYLESLAYQAMAVTVDLERRLATPGKRRDQQKLSLVARLSKARQRETRAIALYDDVALLYRWLREDILSVAGPAYATRQTLFDFVVQQLRLRAPLGPQGIGEIATSLANQRQSLLAFVQALDEALAVLAAQWAAPVSVLRELLRLQGLSENNPRRWSAEATLRQQLGGRYHGLSVAVSVLAARVVRASSVVENLNSRLRGYFFLRRELGDGYLSLLQFFLNHRRFQRSEHAGRAGKSPAELLTGSKHTHWLELLGYQRFECN